MNLDKTHYSVIASYPLSFFHTLLLLDCLRFTNHLFFTIYYRCHHLRKLQLFAAVMAKQS